MIGPSIIIRRVSNGYVVMLGESLDGPYSRTNTWAFETFSALATWLAAEYAISAVVK